MTDKTAYKTPGVYITEADALPQSIVGATTALPLFIGYTEKTGTDGTSLLMQPVMIRSLAEFERTFGKGRQSRYKLAEVEPGGGDITVRNPADGTDHEFALTEDGSGWRFHLYKSIRFFFRNGGTECYVISVGDYGTSDEEAGRGVLGTDLEKGLEVAVGLKGPTMLVIPDAVLLPNDGNPEKPWLSSQFLSLTQAMLEQCESLGDRIALLDVYGTPHVRPDKGNMEEIFEAFRLSVGERGLSYGAAYFPFLKTTILSTDEIDFTSIVPESREILQQLLMWENAAIYNGGTVPPEGEKGSRAYESLREEIARIGQEDLSAGQVASVDLQLQGAFPTLGKIEQEIVNRENILPPAPALAGIYGLTDATDGVWKAPAGISVGLQSVTGPTVAVTDRDQEGMNIPLGGKAINAIRLFTGAGTIIWGARTLDGNSNEWRYIQVRRTLIYIEQSIKNALSFFVFSPNDASTWAAVTLMVGNFLNELWKQGGLMGSKPGDAYSVRCGLGTTMSEQDILNGNLIVQVMVAPVHPAEYVVLQVVQKIEEG